MAQRPNEVGLLCILLILAGTSFALCEDAKKRLSKAARELFARTAKFAFVYFVVHCIYFALLYFLYTDLDMGGGHGRWKLWAFALILPLLAQLRFFPHIQKRKWNSYASMKIAIDFALVLSIIFLFLSYASPKASSVPMTYLATGMSIYFSLSKVLIDFLVLSEAKED